MVSSAPTRPITTPQTAWNVDVKQYQLTTGIRTATRSSQPHRPTDPPVEELKNIQYIFPDLEQTLEEAAQDITVLVEN